MKIAFVTANRETLPDPVVPLGLLYVMANTPPGHELVLWDLCFEAEPYAHLQQRISAFGPDLIAVGMRNIQCNDYSGHGTTLAHYERVFEVIRATTSVPVVLGGGGFSVMPEELMRRFSPDYGICGEGERAFSELVNVLAGNQGSLDQIANLHYFRRSEQPDSGPVASSARAPAQLTVVPARGVFQNLDALRPPSRAALDARYYLDVGIDAVQTKRGCSLRCDYCTYPTIEGRISRQRRPEQVVDELLAAREERAATHFFIVDSVFNLPAAHAKAVCREMIRRGFDTPWTCYVNPMSYDAELAQLMVEAGCAGMEVGSDSGVDEVLARLQKGFTTEHIRALHQRASAAGIPDCHSFILGTPGETLDDVRRTLEFCADLDPFAAIMMPWTDDREALDPELAKEHRAFRRRIEESLREMQRDLPHWIVPALALNFDPALFRMLRRGGYTGPLWQHIRRARGRTRRRRRVPSL